MYAVILSYWIERQVLLLAGMTSCGCPDILLEGLL